jgi:GNAT superfamily N-acetyltransferase
VLGIRQLDWNGLDRLLAMGAAEGWNLGCGDADAFWAQDPEAFIGAEFAGVPIGGGSIVTYGDRYGFMGLFLLKPEFRGRGFGRSLWFVRRDRLLARLAPGASIGMAAVNDMRPFYERGGVRADHLEVRYEWTARAAGTDDTRLADAHAVDRDALHAFDALHFPARRPRFLDAWIAPDDRHALVATEGGAITGFIAARPAMRGHRIGPLFARDAEVAAALLEGIERRLDGRILQLDVPEVNAEGTALAKRRGAREVFSCTRMHYGPAPELPWNRIFGVTSFELG